MKLTVYIDILLAVNIIINYMMINMACLVSGYATSTKRKIVSSVIGALFSLVIFIDVPDLFSFILKVFSVFICGLTAFGYGGRKIFLKNIFSLMSVNVVFSGFIMLTEGKTSSVYTNNYMYYFSINPVTLVMCIFILYLLLSLGEIFFSIDTDLFYTFVIVIEECEYKMTGFYDTGFGLKDIINNRAVVMCSYDTIKNMVSAVLSEEIDNFFVRGEYYSRDIFPLFYSDVSGKGMLPALKPGKIYIEKNGKRTEVKNAAIVVCRQKLPAEYQLIFGKQIFQRTGIGL